MIPISSNTCQLCHNADLTILGKNPDFEGHDVIACSKCGFMFTYPIPTDDDLSVVYKKQYRLIRKESPDEFYLKFMQLRAIAQKQFIEDSLKFGTDWRGKTVVDIGCGAGLLLLEFEKSGARVIGFEPDLIMNQTAVTNLSEGAVVHSSLFSAESMDNMKADLVCMSHVLEHIGEPEAYLIQLKRVLNQKGAIFIEVPAETKGGVWEQCKHRTKGLMHLIYFTPKSINLLSRSAGFIVASIHCFGPNRWLNSVVHPRHGRMWRRLLYYPLRAVEKALRINGFVNYIFGLKTNIDSLNRKNSNGSAIRCVLIAHTPQ